MSRTQGATSIIVIGLIQPFVPTEQVESVTTMKVTSEEKTIVN